MEWKAHNNWLVLKRPGFFMGLSFTSEGDVRLRTCPHEDDFYGSDPWSPVLAKEPECTPAIVAEANGGLRMSGESLVALIHQDGSLNIQMSGKSVFSTPGDALIRDKDVIRFQFCVDPAEGIYGLGQDPMAALNQNGRERRMWNQWGGKSRSGNCGIGFFTSTTGYGFLLGNTEDARFRFNEAVHPELDSLGEAMVPSLWDEGGPLPEGTGCVEVRSDCLDAFLFFKPTAEELIRDYYRLTGFPSLLPKWAFGLLQCKNRYMNRADLERVVRIYREKGIPCDALIIDWLWFEEFGDLEWKESDWRDAGGMLAELSRQGVKVLSAQHPFISEKSKYYDSYLKEGFLNQVPKAKRITYDHTHPKARMCWWKKTAELYRQGLRGYWTDMGELEEHFEGTVSHAGSRNKTHNAYSLMWSKGLFEGQTQDFGTRPVIVSRSGCAGIQKYGAILWSGDINASWEVLRRQIVTGQGVSMSGLPYWTTDIGGFLTGYDFSPELYIRWMEWGVFCSIFRTHGTRPANEPWSFGPDAEEILTQLIRLRYRLLPYIYSAALENALEGRQLVRPMALAYPEDVEAQKWEDQFMFGSSILVAPVAKPGQRSRRVYLPKGEWHHWWTGRRYSGGIHTIVAPLGEIPFFVKAGSIVPTYERIGRGVEDCGDLAMLVFPGKDEVLEFYDDAGEGLAYQTGGYSHIQFIYKDEPQSLNSSVKKGDLPSYQVVFINEQVRPARQRAVTMDADLKAPDQVTVTLSALEQYTGPVRLELPAGWAVKACSWDNGNNRDIYELRYPSHWEGTVKMNAGEVIRWQLIPVGSAMPLEVQKAVATVGGETLCCSWEGRYITRIDVAACFKPAADSDIDTLYPLEVNPYLLHYEDCGKEISWRRDPLCRDSFGYVDFRRFGCFRDGEEISGVAYGRANLYSKSGETIEVELRHDSSVKIWVNGEEIWKDKRQNVTGHTLKIPVKPGKNILLVKQWAQVARPYSGGEFGFSMKLVSAHKIDQL